MHLIWYYLYYSCLCTLGPTFPTSLIYLAALILAYVYFLSSVVVATYSY